MPKILLEDIKRVVENEDWKLLSTEYKNLNTEMHFQCSEGHDVYATWGKLRERMQCPICDMNEMKDPDQNAIPKKKDVVRVLALDQASHTSGWCIYDGGQLVTYGLFTTKETEQDARINEVKHWMASKINNWEPDVVAIEGIQFEQYAGVTTFEALARLQGVLIDFCYEKRLPVEICHTAKWRSVCGVKGKTRADKKKSMKDLVKKWYDVNVPEDAADAIGIGKYCVQTYKPRKVIKTSKKDILISDWE